MSIENYKYYPSYTAFISAYNLIENIYMTTRNVGVPIDNPDFSEAFFYCYDYLSSLKKEELEELKSDVNLHCKITMYDTMKLDIIARNPSMLKIPGIMRFF